MKTTISKIAGLCFIATALISCSKSNDKSGEIIKITDGAFEMPNAIHQLGK